MKPSIVTFKKVDFEDAGIATKTMRCLQCIWIKKLLDQKLPWQERNTIKIN